MHVSEEFELPLGLEARPKREKSRLAKVWDHFQELRRVVDEKGMLVPQYFVADLLGISRQRVHQLVNDGRFEVVELQGHRYLTETSVVSFAQDERKNGRPMNPPATLSEAIRRASEKTSRNS